jgi:hypothetical protein
MSTPCSLDLYLLSFADEEIDPSCEQAIVVGRFVVSQITFEVLSESFPNVNTAKTLREFANQFGDFPQKTVALQDLSLYCVEESTHKDWEKIFSSVVFEFFRRAARRIED